MITHIIVGVITGWPVALNAKASTVILAMGGDFLSGGSKVVVFDFLKSVQQRVA